MANWAGHTCPAIPQGFSKEDNGQVIYTITVILSTRLWTMDPWGQVLVATRAVVRVLRRSSGQRGRLGSVTSAVALQKLL